MQIWEVFLIALGLSADAFAASVVKGLANGKISARGMLVCGLWFGLFQAGMPLIGYALASLFSSYIEMITPWISFSLLAFLGVKMIVESILSRRRKEADDVEPKTAKKPYGFGEMLMLAVATSIDALAVGVTFAFNGVVFDITQLHNIWLYIGITGIVTFVLSAAGNGAGSALGSAFGKKFGFVAELIGGAILCALAVKFLVTGIVDLAA